MTCIVGIEDHGRVLIGGDSAVTDSFAGLIIMRDPKVFRLGPLVIGVSGSLRMTQLLQHAVKVPKRRAGVSDGAFIRLHLMTAIRKAFCEHGWVRRHQDGNELAECFLIGYGSQLYTVEDDFNAMTTVDGCDAVGCGCRYAMGSLYSTRSWDDNRGRLMEALEAACACNAHCRPPFTVLST